MTTSTNLYTPARAVISRRWKTRTFGGAKHLAAWKKRVTAAWPGVRVEHIEARDVSDALEFGTVVSLRAVVALGDLAAEDVDVQVAYGRVDEHDQIIAPTYSSLRLSDKRDDGSWVYEGEMTLDRTGPFGYSVRVLPTDALARLAGRARTDRRPARRRRHGHRRPPLGRSARKTMNATAGTSTVLPAACVARVRRIGVVDHDLVARRPRRARQVKVDGVEPGVHDEQERVIDDRLAVRRRARGCRLPDRYIAIVRGPRFDQSVAAIARRRDRTMRRPSCRRRERPAGEERALAGTPDVLAAQRDDSTG